MTVAKNKSKGSDSTLTRTESRRLRELERVIGRGLETFLEVGQSLMEIRDSRLYRETHPKFQDYCRERWGFTARRGNQLIQAAKVGTVVPVENERQARELAGIAPEDAKVIREVWDRAVEIAAMDKSEPGKVTASALRAAGKIRMREVRQEEKAFRMQFSPRGSFWGGGGSRGNSGPSVPATPVTLRGSIAAAERGPRRRVMRSERRLASRRSRSR